MAIKKTAQKEKKAVIENKKAKTLVLLDAHAILHRAYHALPDFTSPKGEPTGALYGVVAMLLKIVEELKPDYIVACFDLPEPTYRHEVFEGYKATRAEIDEMLVAQINRSRDVFEAFGIRIFEHPGFEADDMLGTIVEQTKKDKNLDIVIASGDMDTLQLVEGKKVRVYTLRKGIKDTVMYDEKAVKERFGFGPKLVVDYKGLRGDPSDNIPGIKGIGEKTATDLITGFGDIDTIYKTLKKGEASFEKAGIKKRIIELLKENEEEAQFSKMLATIRRDAPVTFELPDKTWREKLDVDAVLKLFAELGFRTLGIRVRELFGGSAIEEVEELPQDVDPRELKETSIALWLLESETTNPTLDDILAFGRANGLEAFQDIKERIFKELKEQDLEKVWKEIELPLIDVLEEMQKDGVALDTKYLKTLSVKMHKELDGLEKRIYKHAGTEFNINSPKQLGDILYDTLGLKQKNQKRTATGQRSTRESELEKLADEHPIIKEILRYRELQKLVGTYIDNLPTMVGPDGRLHTTFLQAGAATGRMATRDPGLQNIPMRTDEGRAVRRGFVAEKGWKLVAIDYSQIELRIAAFLAEDKKLIDIFKRGEDVHTGVALRVFGVNAGEVTPDMRRRAKVINFGILYGMGVNALRANLGEDTSRAEAQEFLNAYFNTFTRLAEYLEETKAYARKHGYTETYFGRKRYFPGINSSAPFIRAQAERMAINAPIQGTEGDIVRIAMVRIYEYLKKEKLTDSVKMILQVHDELVFEIKEGKVKEVVPRLKEIMEGVMSEKETKSVPIATEVKVGDNWEEMEKLKV
jgi:DNA polymerase-1